MKRVLLFVILFAVNAFPQTTWYRNPKSLDFALVNESIDIVHTTIATCDSASLTFSKTTLGQWEIALYDSAGNKVWEVDSLGNMIIDPTPPYDHSFSGPGVLMTVGEKVYFGEALYMKSDGKLWKTDADAYVSIPGLWVCGADSIAADASGKIALPGSYIRDDTWDWTVGDKLFLSCTAGDFTSTAPSGAGDQLFIAAIATSADEIFFFPFSVVEKSE